MRNASRILVEKLEATRPPAIQRHGWEDNIKKGSLSNRIGWYGLDLSSSEYGPVTRFCEHGDE
jgi:hypothetical protein